MRELLSSCRSCLVSLLLAPFVLIYYTLCCKWNNRPYVPGLSKTEDLGRSEWASNEGKQFASCRNYRRTGVPSLNIVPPPLVCYNV